jgi:predicted membrane protein
MILFIGTFLYLSFILSITFFLAAVNASSSENGTAGKNSVDNLLLTSLIFTIIYIIGSVLLIIRIIVVALRDYKRNRNKHNRVESESESLLYATAETP